MDSGTDNTSVQKYCRKVVQASMQMDEEEGRGQNSNEPANENSLDEIKLSDDGGSSSGEENFIDSEETKASSDWKLHTNYSNRFIDNHQRFTMDSKINMELPEDFDELTIFEKFFPKSLREIIANETNRYYLEIFENSSEKSRLASFKRIDEKVVLKFVGTLLAMGVYPRKTLHGTDCLCIYYLMLLEYWEDDPIFSTNFSIIMKQYQWRLIWRVFHLSDNKDPKAKDDVLFKVRPVVDILNQIWQKNFIPGKNLCIDEAVIKYKCRLKFKQYLKDKPNRWGIKAFLLADAESKYVLRARLYTGRLETKTKGLHFPSKIVREMMNGYLDLGHHLFIDNYYTNLRLVEDFRELNTPVTGTFRKRSSNLPSVLKEDKKMDKHEIKFYVKEDTGVIACLWQDRKLVRLLTTGYPTDVCSQRVTCYGTTETHVKPLCIQRYVENMRGIDVGNQIRSYYYFPHRSVKWWKKVFIEMLEITTVNAYICFKSLAKGDYYDQREFRINLMKMIFKQELDEVQKEKIKGKAVRHYPEYYEKDKKNKSQRARIRCKECSNPTIFICGKCSLKSKADVGLCVPECYRNYHENMYKT